MREPNLIEIVMHGGTHYEKRYLVTEEEQRIIDNMLRAADELRSWVDDLYSTDRVKKQSMHGLANRMLRAAREMMETFDRLNH